MTAKAPSEYLTRVVTGFAVLLVLGALAGCDWFSPPVPPTAANLIIKPFGSLESEVSGVSSTGFDKGAVDLLLDAALLPMRVSDFVDIALGTWTPDIPPTYANGEYSITWDTSFESFIWEFFHNDEGGFLVTIVAAQSATDWIMVVQKDHADFVRAALSGDGVSGTATISLGNAYFVLEWGKPGDAGYEEFYDLLFYDNNDQLLYELYLDYSGGGSTGQFDFINHVHAPDSESKVWP